MVLVTEDGLRSRLLFLPSGSPSMQSGDPSYLRIVYFISLYTGLGRSMQEIFKMLPYLVTIIVLIITSLRKKREQQPPNSLGLAYFREDR